VPTFTEFLAERFITIGFNIEQEELRDRYRNDLLALFSKSYEKSGGYNKYPTGSPEEYRAISDDIDSSLIKAVVRGGKITAANLYKKRFGRKSIASATDGTEQGKSDWLKIKLEDHEQKRAWGEVSDAVEQISKKIGVPYIPADRASKLLGKEVDIEDDNIHYRRTIGGKKSTKAMMGHPVDNDQ